MPLGLRAVILALLALLAGRAALAGEAPLITMANGTYRAVAPPGWDGKSELPLLLYLHGYRQSSAEITADADLVGAVTGAGALMVVPDGLDNGWGHVGAPTRPRDDLAFLHAVVADAERRWPVDRRHVFAAGFSVGGSMVWDLACHAAQGFAAFLPVAGGFWMPYPDKCETGPVNLRHVHGWSDTTVPMVGRTIRGVFHQGKIMEGWAILEATDRCPAEPDSRVTQGRLECETWSSCASGRRLQLCLHSGYHEVEGEWLREGIQWAMALPDAG
jgi:polyhydroxybutyrate depolymerase